MTRMLLAVLIILGMFGSSAALMGCNTIAGAGTDVSRTGDAIHDSARDVQKKI
jgi:entericidin B